MVLAAQHIGDAHVDVVDHAGQQVEPRSVGPAHHRVGHLRRIEVLGPANAVGPFDRLGMVEPEAPVRLLSRRCLRCMIGLGQRQRGPVVDRRQPAPEQHLALELEFLRCLVAAIDPPRLDQPRKLPLIQIEPRRLPRLPVGHDPEPGEIGADRRDMLLAAALEVGIVDPEQKAPGMLSGQQPVVQRRADIADVQIAGGRGSEAGGESCGTQATFAAMASRNRFIGDQNRFRTVFHYAVRNACVIG